MSAAVAPVVTRWASPESRVALRARPAAGARPLVRLHLYTEDGFPEVDIVRAQRTASDGVRWLRISEPHKPRAVTGWVPAGAMGPQTVVTTELVVSLADEHAMLYRSGRVIWSAPVGVGKATTPTPPGSYWIREKFVVTDDPFYGPRAFGTSDYSPYETDWPGGGVVGIHGTNAPSLIPGRPSHGCIRVRDADILRLYPLMPVGTPVVIR